MTGFDYTSTARRPAYAGLPPEVRSSLADVLGGSPDDVRPAGGGFTPGFAATVRRGGGSVFVKAAQSTQPFAFPAYSREAEILLVMPTDLPVPRLLATRTVASTVDDTSWIFLVIEHIEGVMPGGPWTPGQAQSVHESLSELVPGLDSLPDGIAGGSFTDGLVDDENLLGIFDRISTGEVRTPFLPELSCAGARDLHGLVGASALLDGSRVVHNDLRPDNIIVEHGTGRAWICDWNWLSRGPAWSDWVGLLPYLRHDGLPVEQLLRSSSLVGDTDPDAIDAWLAVLAAHMVRTGLSPEIPHSPDLRNHARFTARIMIDWLSERRKWAA